MGWDCYAIPRSNTHRKDPHYKDAVTRVVKIAGACDGLLAYAALDCSDCGLALESATGQSVYSEDDWSPEKVQRLAANARWEDIDGEPWAVESAKAFLNTTARLGRGVRFSW